MDVDEEEEEEEQEEVEEEEWWWCLWDLGSLGCVFGEIEETLGGGGGGVRCLGLRGGEEDSGGLLATMSPWSLSTTSASRLSAWAFSSTLSDIISVAATIFWPRWRTSWVPCSMVLATV